MSGKGAGSGLSKWNIRLWRPRRGGSSSKYERRVGPTHAFEDGTSASGASKDLKSGAGRVIPRDRHRAHAEPPVIIPRLREESKAPAHHPAPSPPHPPLPIPSRARSRYPTTVRGPLTKYVPFHLDHQPQETKGGVPLALSQIRRGGRNPSKGPLNQRRTPPKIIPSFRPRAGHLPPPSPKLPPPTPHPTPFPHSLKPPSPPPNTPPQYFALYRLCLPYGLIALATRHNDTYNSCQARPLNSGTPPRCQPRATTKTSFSLATKSTL